jgi:hypothetical protein
MVELRSEVQVSHIYRWTADSASAASGWTLRERYVRSVHGLALHLVRLRREFPMRPLLPRLVGALASVVMILGACSSDTSEPRSDTPSSDGSILTTFDRLTLGVGDRASFRAFLVSGTARLGSAGLAFASGAPLVARVTAAGGRAQVQGIAAGRTWVVVRGAVASDSVEVIVQ